MRKISLLLMLSLVLTVLGDCGDRQADVENHKNDHKIQILKKPFSTTPGWFNQEGLSVFYAPTKADESQKSGLIDFNGRTVMPARVQEIFPAGDGNLFSFKRNGKFGLMDESANELLKPVSDSQIIFNDHIGCFEQNGQYGIIKSDMTLTSTLSDTPISFGGV